MGIEKPPTWGGSCVIRLRRLYIAPDLTFSRDTGLHARCKTFYCSPGFAKSCVTLRLRRFSKREYLSAFSFLPYKKPRTDRRGRYLFHECFTESPDNTQREIQDKKQDPKNHRRGPLSINSTAARAAHAIDPAKTTAPR